VPSFAEIVQLKVALASCAQQMEQMQKEFAVRNQPAQPSAMQYSPPSPGQFGAQPVYGQQMQMSAVPPLVMLTLQRARMPNARATGTPGHDELPTESVGDMLQLWTTRACESLLSTLAPARRLPDADVNGTGRIQQVTDLKEL